MNQHHIFFDVETSHLQPEKGEILEIAAIRTDEEGQIVAKCCDRVCPTMEIDPSVIPVNGYNEKDWSTAVPFRTALGTLRAVALEDYTNHFVVVAHFAPFDQSFLLSECKKAGLENPFPNRIWVDTAQLAWPLVFSDIIENRKLETLCNYYDVAKENLHTAYGDANALRQIYWKMMARYKIALNVEGKVKGVVGGLLGSIAQQFGF